MNNVITLIESMLTFRRYIGIYFRTMYYKSKIRSRFKVRHGFRAREQKETMKSWLFERLNFFLAMVTPWRVSR